MVFAIEWTEHRPTAAELLGATGVNVFLAITVPFIEPDIVAGMVPSPGAPGEFGATITFVCETPGESRTLLVAVHTPTHASDGDLAALCPTVAPVALSMMVLVASKSQARHKSRCLSSV
jgi:ABC-type molybdate transport system permease subunit